MAKKKGKDGKLVIAEYKNGNPQLTLHRIDDKLFIQFADDPQKIWAEAKFVSGVLQWLQGRKWENSGYYSVMPNETP